ncbi:MAG: bestrophin family ion channel [Pseudomonadota bacterium]
MIVRPRQHWIRMLFVWRGSVLGRILPQLAVVILWSLGVALIEGTLHGFKIDLTIAPFTLLGIALAIFLGFRNSVSYDRYWEARKLWGALLNDARSLTRQIMSLSDADSSVQRRFAYGGIAFVHALKHQLRGTRADADLARCLPPEWQARVQSAQFKPAVILVLLADVVRELRQNGQLSPMLAPAIDRHLSQLNEALGGCERIASTPIPFAYSVILHRTAYLYSFLLPFGLVHSIGLLTPLIVAFVSYTFFALEALAEEIQEPFGTEPNDLALDAMSIMIESTVREMLGESDLPEAATAKNYILS